MNIHSNRPKGFHQTKLLSRKVLPCRATPLSEAFSPYAWKDKRCFIVGGGPSLRAFSFNQLDGELTIGINKAFTAFSPTINYGMDETFYLKVSNSTHKNLESQELHRLWQQYNGYKVFLREKKDYRFDPSIYYVPAMMRKAVSYDLSLGIYPGNNSGFGALMLATALGATKIGLLGYDMKCTEEQTHWHEGYFGQVRKEQNKKLQNFIKVFCEFANTFEAYGVDVVNLNPDSGLKCFRFGSFEEFVNE